MSPDLNITKLVKKVETTFDVAYLNLKPHIPTIPSTIKDNKKDTTSRYKALSCLYIVNVLF
jgi:hypothetical protein